MNILNYIEEKMKEVHGDFSRGQKKIGDYILQHYDAVAFETASQLGQNCGVSESTVVRFAVAVGFDGYPQFQKALQEAVRMRLTSEQRLAIANHRLVGEDALSWVLQREMDAMRHTLQTCDRQSFNDAVEKICSCRNLYIAGVRSASTLASFLNYNFHMISDNVRLITTPTGGEVFEQMLSIGESDVLLAISFPRYSKRIVNAVRFAHEKGACVVALTDSNSSPIVPFAEDVLLAQSDIVGFVDDLTAPMSVLNALLAAITQKQSEKVGERLQTLEKMWQEYNIY